MFKNRVLRSGIEKEQGQETGEDCIMKSFITCIFHQILFGDQI
jgi:hypothetical protein